MLHVTPEIVRALQLLVADGADVLETQPVISAADALRSTSSYTSRIVSIPASP